MRERFMETLEGPDPREVFESVKARYGVQQYMRIPYPDDTDPYKGGVHLVGTITVTWDILSWAYHLDPTCPQMKPSHIYQEKVNYWYSAAYRAWLAKVFERLYTSPGVCGVMQDREMDTPDLLDRWTFFGWYDGESVTLPARVA